MPRLQIELDTATSEALSSLAGARGTTPADLVAEIVEQYVQIPPVQSSPEPLADEGLNAHADDGYRAPPDPLDALVGKYRGDRINDIDEVVYGR